MSLFLKCKDCKVAIVLYNNTTVLTCHDPKTQSLTLPIVPVMKKHLTAVLDDHPDEITKAIGDVSVELDPVTGAFAYAALEYVTAMNYKVRGIRHVKGNDSDYLFKCDTFHSFTEVFAVEVIDNPHVVDETMVGIKVDKIFCKLGTANNHDMNVFYNGLKIDPLSAIVLIEYWNLRFVV